MRPRRRWRNGRRPRTRRRKDSLIPSPVSASRSMSGPDIRACRRWLWVLAAFLLGVFGVFAYLLRPNEDDEAVKVLERHNVTVLREPRLILVDSGALHLGHARTVLHSGPLTKEVAEAMASLSALHDLDLFDMRPCDISMLIVAIQSPRLQELYLSDSEITDDHVQAVCTHTKVRVIALSRTPISDQALTHCEGMPSLKVLYLEGTKVSGKRIVEFRARRPDVYLHLDKSQSGGGP
jgi:hypothetical protein